MSKTKSKTTSLFGDDSVENLSFKVNRDYSERFDERKRRQELARAEELGLLSKQEPDSEELESEDEGDQITPDVDAGIRATIEAIRKKDPRIYDPSADFFRDIPVGERSAAKVKKEKKQTARDVLRKQLLEAAEEGRSDAFADDDDDHVTSKVDSGNRRVSDRMYDEEQAKLRAEFLSGVKAQESILGNDSDSDDNLLSVKPKSKAQLDEEAEEYRAAQRDQAALKKLMSTESGELATHGSEIKDPDAFLSKFASSHAWKLMEMSDDDDEREKLVDSAEEDEEELLKAEEFEATYNFRFEDPNGSQIAGHSRVVPDSLRRVDNKRKEERERRQERKQQEKKDVEQETRRLMNLKRAEIKSRVGKIKTVAGNGVDMDRLAEVFGDELDADFDPETYDKKMAELFGDDYYGEAELEDDAAVALGDPSEVSSDSSDSSSSEDEKQSKKSKNAPWIFGDGPRPAWAGPSAEELANGADPFAGSGPDLSLGEFDYDAVDEEVEDTPETGRVRGGRRAREAKKRQTQLQRIRKQLDEEAAREAENEEFDEVLQMGYEDVIAGGLKTRFPYKQVPSEDYGLSTEEILMLDDADLSSLVSLKRLAPYRENEWNIPKSKKKSALKSLRKKVKENMAAMGYVDDEEMDDQDEHKVEKKEKKEKKEKRKRDESEDETEEHHEEKSSKNDVDAQDSDNDAGKEKEKKKRRKHKKKDEERKEKKKKEKLISLDGKVSVTASRLDSYK